MITIVVFDRTAVFRNRLLIAIDGAGLRWHRAKGVLQRLRDRTAAHTANVNASVNANT